MYLSRPIMPGIFVSEIKTTVPLRNIILITIIILWQIPSSWGQQVYPGDINNNGIVNNIDVLYWGLASGASGEARANPSSDWAPQPLPSTLWDQSFPNGLNYAYADCDGDGDVDDDDRAVITANFLQEREGSTADDYETGNPAEDPILLLSAEVTTIAPNGSLVANLDLGSAANSIEGIFGVAFKVIYDPDFVKDVGNPVKVDVSQESWLHGAKNNDVITFFRNVPEEGVAYFTLVRKTKDNISGFGEVGTVSIVMEDIVFGYSTIGITDVKAVDVELNDFPVAPSGLAYTIDGKVTPIRERIETEGLKVFPNPAGGTEIRVELENPQERIQHIQVFDLNGRLLVNRKTQGANRRERIDIGTLSGGIYSVKIISDKRVYVRGFVRE